MELDRVSRGGETDPSLISAWTRLLGVHRTPAGFENTSRAPTAKLGARAILAALPRSGGPWTSIEVGP